MKKTLLTIALAAGLGSATASAVTYEDAVLSANPAVSTLTSDTALTAITVIATVDVQVLLDSMNETNAGTVIMSVSGTQVATDNTVHENVMGIRTTATGITAFWQQDGGVFHEVSLGGNLANFATYCANTLSGGLQDFQIAINSDGTNNFGVRYWLNNSAERANLTANGVKFGGQEYSTVTLNTDLVTSAYVFNARYTTSGELDPIKQSLPDPVVPEPATATLSLLALAGLAARRRRK